MEARFNFNKREINKLEPPAAGKRTYFWDTEVRGLALDVTASGRKTFYVRRKVDKKRHVVLIGRYPDVTIEQARKRALEICGQLAVGEEPRRNRPAAQKNPTLGELLGQYMENHAKVHCLAWKEIEAVFRRYLSGWSDWPVNSITPNEVTVRMNQIGHENGPVAANHTITYAKAALNWCIKSGLMNTANPWIGAQKFKTQARERFLRPEEIGRFFDAMKKMSNEYGLRDYFYICLFTGARRMNVLMMRWEQVDLKLGTWTIPRTKSGDSQTIPLTSMALDILKRRAKEAKREKIPPSEWVFPSKGKTGHLVEPKRGWHALLAEAEIDDLRLHDLRRTLGSYLAMGNQSLHIIGKVLGHRSPTATQIYSRLTHDPLRQAMEKAQKDMFDAAEIPDD